MFRYYAKLVRVVDGDTIDVELDHGFSIKHIIRLRLAGIDTEELNDPNTENRVLALAAKRFTQEQLENRILIIQTLKTKSGKERETFGRYVALVYYDDLIEQGVSAEICFNDMLVKEGFAKEWRA